MGSDPLVEAVLQQLARGARLNAGTYVLIAVISMLAGAFGQWLASYMRAKGANLATREDFEVLLAQLVQQTKATESIRTDLLNRTWLSQRQWDLKRDLYRDMLLAIENCLWNITNAVNYEESAEGAYRLGISQRNDRDAVRERSQRFLADHLEGVGELQRVKATAQIFLSDGSRIALERFFVPARVFADGAEGVTLALLKSEKERILELRATMLESARRDLELPAARP